MLDCHIHIECGDYSHEKVACRMGLDIDLIKSLKTHNVKIQTASDAHCPEDVGLHMTELKRILAD